MFVISNGKSFSFVTFRNSFCIWLYNWEVEFSKLGTHLVGLYILFYARRIQFRTTKGQHVTRHTFFSEILKA
jgi:hypothetical protein